jgi:hypothetical protein
MKIPSICKKTTSFDRADAGWYVRNSVRVQDIVPEWTLPGGGICQNYLKYDIVECLNVAINYSQNRILEAEAHIKKLQRAIDEASSNDTKQASKS